ncbi:MAG: hypothetical protein JOY81_12310 [Alphaproteobacteria bacterium]|nr:hypothetical protein [Alphaproteobacteria bacterium]
MILGMSLETFTQLHVAISVVGILTGAVVLMCMIRSFRIGGWNEIFLATTLATSVTGFLFPYRGVTPAIVVGIISVAVLALAFYAFYVARLEGFWRRLYADCAIVALYFNSFVFVVQAFAKLPSLKMIAPTQSEPPFIVAQGAVLLVFIIGGFVAQRRFARV